METALLIVHVLISLSIVGLVLIQHGKGADAGAAFGSGASATVFGARGSGSFLTRATGILATLFFVTSLSLAYFVTHAEKPSSVLEQVAPAAEQAVETPATTPAMAVETEVPAEKPMAEDVPVAPADVPQAADAPAQGK